MPVSGPLSDTGVNWCADEDSNNLDCPQATHPGQDGDHGRDADSGLVKTGGGHAGFDFTKLDADGTPLTDQGADYATTPWACVRDNHTGLIWEVKVDNSSSLHHKDHIFSWYNSDPDTNGGDAGTANGGTCVDEDNCDTEKFVAAVNTDTLCGASDWRMPGREELRSILNYGVVNPAIDSAYFPNTNASQYWSSSPGGSWNLAWDVYFSDGHDARNSKYSTYRVRLVRGGE
jgi:hypothetical protein